MICCPNSPKPSVAEVGTNKTVSVFQKPRIFEKNFSDLKVALLTTGKQDKLNSQFAVNFMSHT